MPLVANEQQVLATNYFITVTIFKQDSPHREDKSRVYVDRITTSDVWSYHGDRSASTLERMHRLRAELDEDFDNLLNVVKEIIESSINEEGFEEGYAVKSAMRYAFNGQKIWTDDDGQSPFTYKTLFLHSFDFRAWPVEQIATWYHLSFPPDRGVASGSGVSIPIRVRGAAVEAFEDALYLPSGSSASEEDSAEGE